MTDEELEEMSYDELNDYINDVLDMHDREYQRLGAYLNDKNNKITLEKRKEDSNGN